jgi:hypothetical protein
MRRLLLAAVLALGVLPVPSADALPPIRVRVHISVPPPSTTKPLSSFEWESAGERYLSRLEEVGGNEDILAVQEAVLRAESESRLTQAVRTCGKDGASGGLQAQFDDDVSTGSTIGSAIGECMTGQLPEATPPQVVDALSNYVATQVENAVDGADDTEPVRVSIAWPDATTGAPASSIGTYEPSPSSRGSFPWPLAALGAGVVLIAVLLLSRRRS